MALAPKHLSLPDLRAGSVRSQLAAILETASHDGEQHVSLSTMTAKEALGEVLEFVYKSDNLWAVTKEMLEAVISHIRAPR